MFKDLVTEITKQYDRWPLWIPVFIGCGIAGYFSLTSEPDLLPQIILVASLSGVWLFCHQKLPHKISLKLLIIAIICLVIGFLAATIRTAYIATPMLQAKQKNVTLIGTIIDIQRRPRQHRIVLSDLNIDLTKVRLTISKKNSSTIKLGDQIQTTCNLLPLGLPVTPGGYDFRRAAFFEGIAAVGRAKQLKILNHNNPTAIRSIRESIRIILQEKLSATAYPIAAALIIGDKAEIPKATRNSFAASGLAHLLAISGLHLSLIAALIFFLIRRGCALFPILAEHYSTKKIAALVAIPVTSVYLAISGFGIPAQRSFIMVCVVMLAIVIDRHALTLRLVSLAATILLLLKPESLISPSFVLSFAAVTALVAFYETYWRYIQQLFIDRPILRYLLLPILGIIVTTIIATLVTSVYAVMFFNRFTLQGIIANLLAIPLTSFFIMPLAFICVLFQNLQLPFDLLSLAITKLISIANTISSWPGATIIIPSPPNDFIILITLGLLWLTLWRERLRTFGIVPIVAGFIIFIITPTPNGFISKSHMAIRQDDHLLVIKGYNNFILEQWQQHLGCKDIHKCQENIIINNTNIMPVSKRTYVRSNQIPDNTNLIIAAKPLAKYLNTSLEIIDTSNAPNTPTAIWFADGRYKLKQLKAKQRPWFK